MYVCREEWRGRECRKIKKNSVPSTWTEHRYGSYWPPNGRVVWPACPGYESYNATSISTILVSPSISDPPVAVSPPKSRTCMEERRDPASRFGVQTSVHCCCLTEDSFRPERGASSGCNFAYNVQRLAVASGESVDKTGSKCMLYWCYISVYSQAPRPCLEASWWPR